MISLCPETIIKQGIDKEILKKRGNANTFNGWIIQRIQDARKQKNFETAIFLDELRKKYLEFETSEKIKINSWRKEGYIKIWNKPDTILVQFPSRRGKDDKLNIQRKEYSKREINQMILCINKLKNEYNNKIPSRQLGEKFYGGNWDSNIFSKRKKHCSFTHLLNILDFYGIIKYNRKGFTSVLKEVREIQEVLK